MAKSNAVWGIDIGQCALKALRCTIDGDGKVVADKYDYIEYPKILSQPEADSEALVEEALQQFLSRNEVRTDSVAISVPGQAGLSRFFKPPPVDAHKLPDIVKYEVKQQIPFPIEEVVWDWQQLGGSIVDNRTVDAEVGLFAMKREAVYRALQPFEDADIDVDVVQLSPLAIFNVAIHDILDEIPDPDDIDPEDPPESVVVMSMGTETTDLIVTNGVKLWLRNIPIGGNHFTKQLSRALKLTQAKSENLKRNAAKAENPKLVFKAMRPVFNDLINEVQRSLNFFQSMDRTAEISRIVLLGNASKLPGLRTFLHKQLDIEVGKLTEFESLTGNDVVGQASFSGNLLSFAPSYGLCLQGLKKAHLKTDLLPQEIKTERIIRAKKPWVLASVGALMLGLLLGYFFKQNATYAVSDKFSSDNISWKQAKDKVKTQKSTSDGLVRKDEELKKRLEDLNTISSELTSATEDKSTWMEILKAIHESLPVDEKLAKVEFVNPEEIPFSDRDQIYIDHMETKYFKDLKVWTDSVEKIYDNQFSTRFGAEDTDKLRELEEAAQETLAQTEAGTETAHGWVIELKCHHYHNGEDNFNSGNWGRYYVLQTMVEKLINGTVEFPGKPDEVEGGGEYRFTDFGISHPTLVEFSENRYQEIIVFGPDGVVGGEAGQVGGADEYENFSKNSITIDEDEVDGNETLTVYKPMRYDFTIQMSWIPRSPKERFEARKVRMEEEKAAAEAKAAEEKSAAQQ